MVYDPATFPFCEGCHHQVFFSLYTEEKSDGVCKLKITKKRDIRFGKVY